ncbi:sel1 repeat family protein, partial [Pseudomonas syringae pv. tagetis]
PAQAYDYPAGVDQAYKSALAWYTRSASADYAPAQYKNGYFSIVGKGVATEYTEARYCLGLAATQGIAVAQADHASLFESG